VPTTGACEACHTMADPHGGSDTARHTGTLGSLTSIDYHDGTAAVTPPQACVSCHNSTNLISIHAGDCAVCHSSPRNTFTTWNKTCQQGGCHPTVHAAMADGHSGGDNCDDCHGGWPIPCATCHNGPDKTPPVSSSDLLTSYVATAAITLSATDDFSVKATYYRLDGGATSTIGATLLVGPPAVGTQSHTLEYWSTDWAGNVETPHKTGTFTVTPDTAPPVTTSDAKASYAGPVTINLTAADNATLPAYGVRGTYWSLDGGPVIAGTVITLPQPANGTESHTIHFWSVDQSGNTEAPNSATFTVTHDGVAPTTTTNLLPLPKWYSMADFAGSTYLFVYLTPVDPAPSSGIAGINVSSTSPTLRFYNANEAWWNGTSWQMTIWYFLADGYYPITWSARDNAGNVESSKTTTIAVDITRPVTTSDAANAYTGTATIHLTPTDGSSGVANTYWKDGLAGVQQSGTTAVIPAPASGTVSHTLVWWSVDNVGNVEVQKSKTFTVSH
jgi:hypothetical protein